jgi:hypothetical protein
VIKQVNRTVTIRAYKFADSNATDILPNPCLGLIGYFITAQLKPNQAIIVPNQQGCT